MLFKPLTRSTTRGVRVPFDDSQFGCCRQAVIAVAEQHSSEVELCKGLVPPFCVHSWRVVSPYVAVAPHA